MSKAERLKFSDRFDFLQRKFLFALFEFSFSLLALQLFMFPRVSSSWVSTVSIDIRSLNYRVLHLIHRAAKSNLEPYASGFSSPWSRRMKECAKRKSIPRRRNASSLLNLFVLFKTFLVFRFANRISRSLYSQGTKNKMFKRSLRFLCEIIAFVVYFLEIGFHSDFPFPNRWTLTRA